MNKAIFIPIITALFATACYKTGVSPQINEFSAAINGDSTVFKALRVDSTGGYLSITASLDTSAASPFISLAVYHYGPLAIGSYPVATTYGSTGSGQMNYFEIPGGVLTEYYSPDAVINITAISKTAITGDFQGDCELDLNGPNSLYPNLDPTHARVVTRGKFTIRRH
jgi:hypothetical protein